MSWFSFKLHWTNGLWSYPLNSKLTTQMFDPTGRQNTNDIDNTGETLVVRHCALDSGTLTQDTELGKLLFLLQYLRGGGGGDDDKMACNCARFRVDERVDFSLLALTFTRAQTGGISWALIWPDWTFWHFICVLLVKPEHKSLNNRED